MRRFIANTFIFTGLLGLMSIPALAWLSTPLEVYAHHTGKCLYQLEAASLGFGESRRVPCGTYGELAVERISEIHLRERS